MPGFHPEKKGFRVFGIAESFNRNNKRSTLAGVVMRRDLIIDGMIFGTTTLQGDDSTDNIISMYRSLARNDIGCIMIDGLIISMYNIIDGKLLSDEAKIPVIAVTFEESKGIENTIKDFFPSTWQKKLEQYVHLGARDCITLKTGKPLYIRYWGTSRPRAADVLNAFTLQGSVPEPIKIAKIAARAQQCLRMQEGANHGQ